MDRKTITVIVACIALMVLWTTVLVPKYFSRPVPPAATNTVATIESTNVESQSAPSPAISEVPPTEPVPVVHPDAPEELLEVVSDQVRYVFTSYGGGIKQIDLLNYPELPTAGTKNNGDNGVASLNAYASRPVLDLVGASLTGSSYSLERTGEGVRAAASLPSGLTVIKEYQFRSNNLFAAQVRFENRTNVALTIPRYELVVGAATPMNIHDLGQEVGVLWFNGKKPVDIRASWFANRTLGCFPGTPRSEYSGGEGDVAWAAVHNQFFALAAVPETNAPAIHIVQELLPKPTPAELSAGGRRINKKPEAYLASLVQPGQTLEPGASSTTSYHFYAGPKEYRRLAKLADELGSPLDLVMGYSGFFGFFAKGLLLGMNWLHDLFHFGYGVAIIVITVIIKLVFWPLTQASTRSMKRMQALQPQMKAIQAKFKDDPAKMNKKMMELWREHKVSPLGGCLPMLLQIPVFFGFFRMIRSAIELRGASFLWVKDLTQPDTLFMIPGIHFPFNLLPLLMGAAMLYQAHLTPPSPGMDPVQQKMMRYMPLMILVFLYNYSAGLTLYWTVQNLLTILQTKLTKMKEPSKAPAATPAATAPVPKKRGRK